MRTGKWNVVATGVGRGEPMQATLEMTTQGGAITLIPARPDGMVLVPAAGAEDAFLVDRTEVSNAEFAAMTGKPRGGNPRAAAAGLTYEDASGAARAAGKRLPTLAQWTAAAFGAPMAKSPRYPWGDADGEPGVNFVEGDDARDVESCPNGRSRAGCFNMAGNVWEWIDYRGGGWLIGGGWQQKKFDRSCEFPDGGSWTADFLRDPLPTADTYNAFTNTADQGKYYKYKATPETTLPQAGMRCVVPLGKPRR
jgi:formylglycine-generating enzyme required for sulfatase activity